MIELDKYIDWSMLMHQNGWQEVRYDLKVGEFEWRHENGTTVSPEVALKHCEAGTTPPPF